MILSPYLRYAAATGAVAGLLVAGSWWLFFALGVNPIATVRLLEPVPIVLAIVNGLWLYKLMGLPRQAPFPFYRSIGFAAMAYALAVVLGAAGAYALLLQQPQLLQDYKVEAIAQLEANKAFYIDKQGPELYNQQVAALAATTVGGIISDVFTRHLGWLIFILPPLGLLFRRRQRVA